MAVDPSVQRVGIGSELLAEALRRLRSSGMTLLWATARDEALPFYERFGFVAVDGSAFTPVETKRPHHMIVLEINESGYSR